ncbi:MAG: hypothetical protein WC214_05620 [Candidatus Omnitrophota bacterium]
MKFTEARKKLKEMAKGEHHSLRYFETITHTGERLTHCEVYINGYHSRSGETWESAIAKMERQISGESEPEYEGQPDG